MLGQDVTFDGNISDVKEQLRQQIAAKFEVAKPSAITAYHCVSLQITASTIMSTDIVTLVRSQKPLIQVRISTLCILYTLFTKVVKFMILFTNISNICGIRGIHDNYIL